MTISVTASDVAARWRVLTSDEAAVATVKIADAIALLNSRFPTLDAAVPDTVPDEIIVPIVVDMVLRVLKNPEGLRSENLGQYAYVRDNTLSSGALYVSLEEAATIAGALSVSTGRAFSIRPYGAPDTLDTFE
jgi:hypothetical protein